MPRHNRQSVLHDKIAPLKKIHGKKVSSEEALHDLLQKKNKASKSAEKTAEQKQTPPNLRAEKPAVPPTLEEMQAMRKDAFKKRFAGTFFETLDLSSIQLADNAKPLDQAVGSTAAGNWLSVYDGCSEQPSSLNYMLANTCLKYATSNDSFIVTGDQYQYFQTTYYNDVSCSGTNTSVDTGALGCNLGFQTQFSSEPLSSNPLPPLGAYATHASYNEASCGGQMLAGAGDLNGVCFSYPSYAYSYKLDFPFELYYFLSVDCSGTPSYNFTSSVACGTSDDDSYAYSQYKLLSGAPVTPATDTEGYLVLAFNDGETCSDVPQQVMGFALDTCQIDASLQTSYKFSCSDGFAYKFVYQSGNCDANTQTFIEKFTLGCETKVSEADDYYYGGTVPTSYALYTMCTNGNDDNTNSVVLPGNAKYGVNSFFDVDNCAGSALSYDAIVNNVCVSYPDFSYQMLYPNLYEYDTTDCTGVATDLGSVITDSSCTDMTTYYGGAQRTALETESQATYYGQFPQGLYAVGSLQQGASVFSSSSSSSSLDNTSIAGLVVGLVILFGIIIGGVIYMVVQRNMKKSEDEVELTKN